MKANEVLNRYAAGERDFRRVNLRGQSFKGKNLSGADFSEADIRGANFTNAYLKNTKFCGVEAGLQRYWAITLAIVSLMLCTLTAFVAASCGVIAGLSIVDSRYRLISIMITLAAIYYFTIHHNLQTTVMITFFALIIPAVIIWSLINTVPSFFVLVIVLAYGASGTEFYAAISAISGAAFGAIYSSRFGAVFSTTFGALVLILTVVLARKWLFMVWKEEWIYAEIGIVTVVVFGFLLSNYISWQALAGEKKYAIIQTVAVAFAARGGTSFRHANLTDADFSQARLKSTDFRRAILTRTCWQKAKKLDRVRPGTTYLQDANLRQLLITGQRQDQNFDRQNLRGVNLQGANLADASFIGADLSEANLQDADLSRAKLVQAQLDEADLTGATLTGATIEDWGITSSTQLHGVRCRYVFMRLPTKDDPNQRRKPDNWEEEFEDGDFADFIKPIVDTLDLYHNQGVDPRAIAISFKQLTENHPDAELDIVAMEKRGEDKFLLRAKTAPDADRSSLNAEYFSTYNQVKSLPENHVQILLAAKDSHIQSLETTIENFINTFNRPTIYAEAYYNQGDTMSEKSETSNYDLRQSKFGGGFAGTGGTQSGGNFYDYSSNPNLSQAAADIQQLLKQLESTNSTNTSAEKMAVATKAVDEIENNPALKARVVAALNSASTEAFKQAISHPLAKNLMPIIEEWTQSE
jgi:uncharacterized protein YjbI with pentapeptide repeats